MFPLLYTSEILTGCIRMKDRWLVGGKEKGGGGGGEVRGGNKKREYTLQLLLYSQNEFFFFGKLLISFIFSPSKKTPIISSYVRKKVRIPLIIFFFFSLSALALSKARQGKFFFHEVNP